ncbi:MAG: GGDEF domain-containing protein, partial [Pseudomonadota bacterium]
MELSPELADKLRNIGNLPSPPQVATEIIDLAQDPELQMDKLAGAISKDPVLTTKILKIANSALYARRRKSDNLAQALLVLGLNATVTLSLSFSLVTSLSRERTVGVNFSHYWRRSLANAVAARALAQHLGLPHREELFLGGLLQDLGMLVIDKVAPDIYAEGADVSDDHLKVADLEDRALGADHAKIGAWLLSEWNIPQTLWQAVGASHTPECTLDNPENQMFGRCVALSGLFSDVLLSKEQESAILRLSDAAESALELDRVTVMDILGGITESIPDTEAVFEMDILDSRATEGIMDQAREILMIRNLQSLREVNSLKEAAETLETRTQELEAENKRDALTGIYNRSHLDAVLDNEYVSATKNGWPLSIAFVDIDFFKKVNDTYGHSAGDTVLRNAAKILQKGTRDTDVVARYGGEEFILL